MKYSFLLFLTIFLFAGCKKDCGPELKNKTLSLQPGSEGKDAMTSSHSSVANSNFKDVEHFSLRAWTISSVPYKHRNFIEFNLSSIPSGATIISAKLSLYHYHHYPYAPDSEGHQGNNSFYIKRVTAYWDESTVTWNNQPSTSELNKVLVSATTSPNQDHIDINIKTLVEDMLSTGNANYGFALVLVNESPYSYIGLASSDIADANIRPKLVVEYSYLE